MYNPALLISICHYVLLAQLNGKIADGEFAPIRQSYVAASSLILANLFRATLLGCVGTCFAQVLWRTLRGSQPIAVVTIEGLFQMRSNPFELADIRLLKSASLAFVIAVYMWLVPLAVTFPPGALTIEARPFPMVEQVISSVINPIVGTDVDLRQYHEGLAIVNFTDYTQAMDNDSACLLWLYGAEYV